MGGVLGLLVAAVFSSVAMAASWDPDLRWQTISTEHFRITFHGGEEKIAVEMAAAAEEAWNVLVPEIGNEPRTPIDIVLVDWTDSANGMAQILPKNIITIYVTQPTGESTLGLYENWNEAIVTHELAHVVHIDTVEGLPRAARWLFGSLISTHQVAPLWTVEGFATFEETRHTVGGRGRTPGVDMIKRASVLEDRFPPLGNMDGFVALPPGGNLRYLFGQDFMQYVAESRGMDKWSEWIHRYGASVPFFLPARRTFGDNFVKLYREWKAHLTERYEAQAAAVRAEGETPFEWLSDEGISCGTPAWAPTGDRLIYSCSDPRRGSAIWTSDGTTAKILAKGKYADDVTWRNDGKAFVYASMHVDDLYTVVDDVFMFDIDKKASRPLTDGKRARDPALSPDGTRIVAVTNELQDNQLAELTVDQRLLPMTTIADGTQFSTPRFSPDGKTLAVSVHTAGKRDLWLYGADGSPIRRLTDDMALDVQPAWSADGRWLYFTSDRSGVLNVYAIDLPEERLYRVTNAVIGAYAPSPHPSGQSLAFLSYTSMGARVATMALDPAKFKDLGALPWSPRGEPGVFEREGEEPEPRATAQARAERAARKARKDGEPPAEVEAIEPVPGAKPYSPLPTLFPPRFWLPGALLTTTGDDWGFYLAAYTGGVDVLRQYSYSAYATYRTDAQFLGGGGSFTVNRWRPVLSASGGTYVTPYGTMYDYSSPPAEGGAWIPSIEQTSIRYWDHRTRGGLSGYYPLDEKSGFSFSYRGELREPKDELPASVYYGALPTRGFFSTLAAGWSRGSGESYALSISPEKARVLGAGVEFTPWWLGSWSYDESNEPQPFDQLQVTGEWREYRPAPWLANHVFAVKASGGFSVGSKFRYGSFRLGGSFSENGITVIPQEWRSLRGFYTGTRNGETFWLASGEYRFPVVYVERGVGTIPFFMRNVSGALVVDAGNAWDDADEAALGNSLVGVGAELRASAIAFYGVPLYGRMGYAFSVLGDGIAIGSLDGLYFEAGTSF